ncbi:MAG: ribose 5-phosphate isomerase B [Bacteriovoracaceae bacterium]|nr:ribose 5-phosphate isomerase B [Bacteriovoracaceae bacterium]
MSTAIKKIFIASDHAAFNEKEELRKFLSKNYDVIDLGTKSLESTHYPIYAKALAEEVLKHSDAYGVLLCGSGIGASIVANRYKGIRAALCRDEYDAEMSRKHNNANVICLGGRVTPVPKMKTMVELFLKSEFEGGRHQVRLDMF